MQRGWIKLWRKIEDSFLYPLNNNAEFSPLEAWIDLLMLANHKKKWWNGIECERGQVAYSVQSYGERWKWSRQKIRTFFANLQSKSQIQIESNHKTTMLTIINYDTYQGEQPTDNQLTTNQQPTDNQPTTTTKELNNPIIKKLKKEYSEDFLIFWRAYPRKEGKADAYKSWVKENAPMNEILSALQWQTTQEQWTKDKGQYIPQPATYINQHRWEDEQKKKEIPWK